MKILICDDEKYNLDLLYAHVTEYMKSHYIECDITAVTDPEIIVRGNSSFDLAFLDIQMDEIDGISLAKILKERNNKLAIFFITNYNDYQDDAMDLRAFRYFEKPFDTARLYAGLDKAMEYIDGAYLDVFLSEGGTQKRVLSDDIMYITRNNRQIIIAMRNGKLVVRDNYDELCQRLPPLYFYPVHKSFFVNLHYVDSYAYSELILTDGTYIPIASRKQANFHKFWYEYMRRR